MAQRRGGKVWEFAIFSCCIKNMIVSISLKYFFKKLIWVTRPDYLPEHLVAVRKKMTFSPLAGCNYPRSQEIHLQFLRVGEEGGNPNPKQTPKTDKNNQFLSTNYEL